MASIRASSLLALPSERLQLHGGGGKRRSIAKLQPRNGHAVMAAALAQASIATSAPAVESGGAATRKALESMSKETQAFKGWVDETRMQEDHRLVAKLGLLQVTAKDRKEMHEIIGQQRDNWNKLFQGTLRLATVSAAVLAAISGAPTIAHATSSLSLCAGVLDVVSALIMVAVNKFQPSQLAEEQRTAARLFGQLSDEIEAVLAIDPRLREDAASFFRDKITKLHALDAAYPLPLTPGGLDKFPRVVAPSWIGTLFDKSTPIIPVPAGQLQPPLNGWTKQIEEDLLRISDEVNRKDIPNYITMCKTVLDANRRLAIAGPALAMLAGIANLAHTLPLAAALCSIGAFFAGSLSHDMQMGMIFEMYRNCAGYYANADASIQRTLRMPVEKREDGELFHQKIAHLLGRKDEFPAVPVGAETAGTLF